MKQKDIAILIVVCVLAAVASLVIARFLFATPKDREQKVEVVDAITIDFVLPDTKYINATSYNPTQSISISDNENNTPFKADKQ